MGDEHSQAHVRKMEAVAQRDEGERHYVVANQFLEVLPGLLHPQEEDDGLLGPVRSLEEVVELEDSLVCPVREVLVHRSGVEVPQRGPTHHI